MEREKDYNHRNAMILTGLQQYAFVLLRQEKLKMEEMKKLLSIRLLMTVNKLTLPLVIKSTEVIKFSDLINILRSSPQIDIGFSKDCRNIKTKFANKK